MKLELANTRQTVVSGVRVGSAALGVAASNAIPLLFPKEFVAKNSSAIKVVTMAAAIYGAASIMEQKKKNDDVKTAALRGFVEGVAINKTFELGQKLLKRPIEDNTDPTGKVGMTLRAAFKLDQPTIPPTLNGPNCNCNGSTRSLGNPTANLSFQNIPQFRSGQVATPIFADVDNISNVSSLLGG